MTVNHEIKSQLAKLLATEDLVVEHKKVETACFNVHTRVLTLPMWEKASSTVYDMLVGHEVGHALYTPDVDWIKKYKIPPQFVNVVEDARIEKLMKRRYAGLSKTFYRGYQELADEDFFSIGLEDVSTYNLADRANLYFKIGNYTQIPIKSGEEMEIINMISNTETFDDVLEVSNILYEYCKKELESENDAPMNSNDSQSGESSQSVQSSDQESDQEQPGETDSYGGTAEMNEWDESDESDSTEQNDDPGVKTMDSLEESLKDLVSEISGENVYLEIPKMNLDKIIIPNDIIHDDCEKTWSDCDVIPETFYYADDQFTKFKQSAQREVNYLVKEFECKKAADSYARATTARTGVLDCSKLHTYKYNEDLFKKVTTLADGKNHGLVFILDWSGSMGNVMMDTIKQLYNLMWFCKKASIPFDVYAFTNEYPRYTLLEDCEDKNAYEPKSGVFHINEWFSLMNIFTSDVNGKTLETQMKNIFRIVYTFTHYVNYKIPMGMSLSGTPLNETLLALHQIIPTFKQKHKIQKVQCVILTDGEGCSLKYHREIHRPWEEDVFLGTAAVRDNAFLRDRKNGMTYHCGNNWYEMTDVLLKNLKDSFKDTNFIGIRILESRDAGSFIRRYCGYTGELHDKTMIAWKKQRAFSLKNSGYHTYFGLSSTSLSNDSEFEVKEDATKSQIKSAFVKSLRSKKMNKKILGEFVELIA